MQSSSYLSQQWLRIWIDPDLEHPCSFCTVGGFYGQAHLIGNNLFELMAAVTLEVIALTNDAYPFPIHMALQRIISDADSRTCLFLVAE